MIDAANYLATETLRDGRTVEIRAQRSQDREGMHADTWIDDDSRVPAARAD